MAFTKVEKNPGDLAKAQEWNDISDEVERLDKDKVDKDGDAISGSLTIDGNLGIGTKTPVEKLHIESKSGSVYGLLQADSNAYWISDAGRNGGGVLVREKGTDKIFVYWSLTEQLFAISEIEKGKENKRFVIKDGNIGIGTDEPNYKLDVRGTIGNNITQYHSDFRWKQKIETIPNALSKVQLLRGVQFRWNEAVFPEMNFPSGQQIGLVAQEVEQVIPEVVSTDDDGYKSVAYANLVGVLVEAVKELQAEVETLKTEMAKMKPVSTNGRSAPAPTH